MWCTDETFGINLSRKTSRYFLLSLYLFWTGALVAMVRHYRQPTEKNLLVNGSRVLIGLLDWVFVSEEIWSWEATYDSLIATDPSEAGEVFVKSWKVRNQMKPKNIVRVKTLISSQESGFWRGGETDLSNNVTKRKYNSNSEIEVWSGLVVQWKVDWLTGQNVIFDILKLPNFRKYSAQEVLF